MKLKLLNNVHPTSPLYHYALDLKTQQANAVSEGIGAKVSWVITDPYQNDNLEYLRVSAFVQHAEHTIIATTRSVSQGGGVRTSVDIFYRGDRTVFYTLLKFMNSQSRTSEEVNEFLYNATK